MGLDGGETMMAMEYGPEKSEEGRPRGMIGLGMLRMISVSPYQHGL